MSASPGILPVSRKQATAAVTFLMLSYFLAGLTGVALTLGGQGATRMVRSRFMPGVDPALEPLSRLATLEEVASVSKGLTSLEQDLTIFRDAINRQGEEVTTLRLSLTANQTQMSESMAAWNAAMAEQGGVVTRRQLEQQIEFLVDGREEQRRLDMEMVGRDLGRLSTRIDELDSFVYSQMQALRALPVITPEVPALTPPFRPGGPAVPSPFGADVATVPLRRVSQPAVDPAGNGFGALQDLLRTTS
jgi:hypothetical protein